MSLDHLKRLLSADPKGQKEYAVGGEVDDPFRSGKPLRTRTRRPATLEENQAMSRAVMQGLGLNPTPANIRNYLLDMIETGEGVLMPYFKSTPLLDVRTQKKEGGEVKSGLSVLKRA